MTVDCSARFASAEVPRLKLIDQPVVSFVALTIGTAASYEAVVEFSRRPALLSRLDPTTRSVLYGSLAGSAGALLGLTLATVAILLTLDNSRTVVREMQSLPAWRTMVATLLVTIGGLGVTLAVSTISLALDAAKFGREHLEAAVAGIAVGSFGELAIACTAFAIVVMNVARR